MADEPKHGSKTDYIKTLDNLARQANRLEDEAVRRAIRLLKDALREINQRVLTAEGWRLSNLENLQRQVNDIMERFRRQPIASVHSRSMNHCGCRAYVWTRRG